MSGFSGMCLLSSVVGLFIYSVCKTWPAILHYIQHYRPDPVICNRLPPSVLDVLHHYFQASISIGLSRMEGSSAVGYFSVPCSLLLWLDLCTEYSGNSLLQSTCLVDLIQTVLSIVEESRIVLGLIVLKLYSGISCTKLILYTLTRDVISQSHQNVPLRHIAHILIIIQYLNEDWSVSSLKLLQGLKSWVSIYYVVSSQLGPWDLTDDRQIQSDSIDSSHRCVHPILQEPHLREQVESHDQSQIRQRCAAYQSIWNL